MEHELGIAKPKKGKKAMSKLQQIVKSTTEFTSQLKSYQIEVEAKLESMKRKVETLERDAQASSEEIKRMKLSQPAQYNEYQPHPTGQYSHPPTYYPHFPEAKSECSYAHDPSFKCHPNCSIFHARHY